MSKWRIWSIITVLSISVIVVILNRPDWVVVLPKTVPQTNIPATPLPANYYQEPMLQPIAQTDLQPQQTVGTTQVSNTPVSDTTTHEPCHLATPVGTKCYALDPTWQMIGTIISVDGKVQVIRVYPEDNPGQPIPTPYYQVTYTYEDGE